MIYGKGNAKSFGDFPLTVVHINIHVPFFRSFFSTQLWKQVELLCAPGKNLAMTLGLLKKYLFTAFVISDWLNCVVSFGA